MNVSAGGASDIPHPTHDTPLWKQAGTGTVADYNSGACATWGLPTKRED